MSRSRETVCVVVTVLNDRAGCAVVLETLAQQTRPPDEIFLADAGSTDGTRELILQAAQGDARIRLIDAPGCNIAQGRNLAIEQTQHPLIATTDAGCRLDPTWLERLIRPFDDDPGVEMVAGFYRIDPHTLLEEVVGRLTMRGQLDPVQPEAFNPSARSMAFRQPTWQRAGGFPDWLYTSEDTLFDIKLRKMGVRWAFAGDAVVHWRPRTSLPSIARQFYLYGRGRGHTQIEAGCYLYNLRNAALMFMLGVAGFGFPLLWGLAGLLAAYFYVWTFHGKAIRVARKIGRWTAYAVALVVCCVVLLSSTAGYVVGSLQRLRRRAVYRDRLEKYLAIGEAHS